VQIRKSVSETELLKAYHEADLFVLPSLAEGFAHVLLEAMASGLPVLSTTNTAAPDLIEPGIEGFVVEPGNVEALSAYIGWCEEHRHDVAEMGRAARRKAESFTWARFRSDVVSVIRQILTPAASREIEVSAC
jgi:glycosyltransferase involved in cell wall biosynthesis